MVEEIISGKNRGFKFGTYTYKLLEKETGVKTIEELFRRLSEKSGENDEVNISFLLSFLFCCAKHYAISKKQEIDFTEEEVADWFDEMGLERSTKIVTELISTYTDTTTKNLKAL